MKDKTLFKNVHTKYSFKKYVQLYMILNAQITKIIRNTHDDYIICTTYKLPYAKFIMLVSAGIVCFPFSTCCLSLCKKKKSCSRALIINAQLT